MNSKEGIIVDFISLGGLIKITNGRPVDEEGDVVSDHVGQYNVIKTIEDKINYLAEGEYAEEDLLMFNEVLKTLLFRIDPESETPHILQGCDTYKKKLIDSSQKIHDKMQQVYDAIKGGGNAAELFSELDRLVVEEQLKPPGELCDRTMGWLRISVDSKKVDDLVGPDLYTEIIEEAVNEFDHEMEKMREFHLEERSIFALFNEYKKRLNRELDTRIYEKWSRKAPAVVREYINKHIELSNLVEELKGELKHTEDSLKSTKLWSSIRAVAFCMAGLLFIGTVLFGYFKYCGIKKQYVENIAAIRIEYQKKHVARIKKIEDSFAGRLENLEKMLVFGIENNSILDYEGNRLSGVPSNGNYVELKKNENELVLKIYVRYKLASTYNHKIKLQD